MYIWRFQMVLDHVLLQNCASTHELNSTHPSVAGYETPINNGNQEAYIENTVFIVYQYLNNGCKFLFGMKHPT